MSKKKPSVYVGSKWETVDVESDVVDPGGAASGGGADGGASSSSAVVVGPAAVVADGAKTMGEGGNDGIIPPRRRPVEAIVGKGNDEIFVSVASLRDGERCGRTLKALFENASEPTKVTVGLVEQNHEKDDKACLTEYCKLNGIEIGPKKIVDDGNRSKCPHHDRVRYLGVHSLAAKGPAWARSLHRKLLGNEEYCLQIDAHTDFVSDWDVVVKREWTATNNEYGILSTIPPSTKDKSKYEEAGGELEGTVPRMCKVTLSQGNGLPYYEFPADGKAANLDKPLLSHAWSAGFSFAKCHLETNAPYDSFAPMLFDAEQFPRFARFWTRGYDVYTPTRNVVYHDYGPNPEGHDPKDWPPNEPMRMDSLRRVKTFLQVPGGDRSVKSQANLGIYGLGKRRTMRQLMEFVNLDLDVEGSDNTQPALKCANERWVPYDASVPAHRNLYENEANDLDPQPEFPLRSIVDGDDVDATKRHASKEEGEGGGGVDSRGSSRTSSSELAAAAEKELLSSSGLAASTIEGGVGGGAATNDGGGSQRRPFAPPSLKTTATLWVFGLLVWYATFANGGRRFGSKGATVGRRKKRKKKGPSSSPSSSGYKNV